MTFGLFKSADAYFDKVFKTGYRSSAVSPLLWLNSLVTLPSIGAYCFVEGSYKWPFAVIVILMVVVTLVLFFFLALKDPKLLQSEKYLLESQKLDLIREKGGVLKVEPIDLNVDVEPNAIPALLGEGEGK